MLISLQNLIPFLIRYKYLIIFPVAVIEGPIITIIAGFLSSLGYLKLMIAYIIVVVGDLTGDTGYYFIGKFGRKGFIRKYGKFIGINLDRVEKLEKHFDQHANKTFIFGKMAHGIGTLVLVAAGLAGISYRKLIALNLIPTLVKSLILIMIGFYFGRAYAKFNTYLDYTALISAVLFVILYIIVVKTKVLSKFTGYEI